MKRRLTPLAIAMGLVLGFVTTNPATATDEPDELMPGFRANVRPGTPTGFGAFAKIDCRAGTTDFDLPDEPANDPTVEGGTLRLFDTGGDAGDDTYSLPAANWSRIPSNPLSTLRGFRYQGARTLTDPCRLVLVRERRVKAICVRQGMSLTPPFNGDLAAVLTVGSASKRYCAQFGGFTSLNDHRLRRKGAPAPGACASPSGAFLEVAVDLLE